jgi:hypothetical protein
MRAWDHFWRFFVSDIPTKRAPSGIAISVRWRWFLDAVDVSIAAVLA